MDATHDLLHQVKDIFIFCIAVTILFMGMKGLDSLIQTSKTNINESNVLYEQYKEESVKGQVSYQEIIAVLLSGLEQDISIDGVEIKAKEYDYLNYDYSIIAKNNYLVSYEYDLKGAIIKVIYKKL